MLQCSQGAQVLGKHLLCLLRLVSRKDGEGSLLVKN